MATQMKLRVGNYSIALDSGEKDSNLRFVSHAHFDHISGVRKGKEALMSQPTKKLIEERKKMDIKTCCIPDGMELLSAGHILGSKQLFIQGDGYSAVYSGDFQMHESAVAEKIKTKKADKAILDSTYPFPEIIFDDKDETIENIQKYVLSKSEKGIVLFGAYALGKSQELIHILNEVGIKPVVHPKVSKLSKIYTDFGINLEYASVTDNELEVEELTQRNFVGIVDPRSLLEAKMNLSNSYGKRVFTAVATGFSRIFNFGVDVSFSLSDHADFVQATEYIDACCASEVYTLGKNAEIFASNLCKAGYNAMPMREGMSL